MYFNFPSRADYPNSYIYIYTYLYIYIYIYIYIFYLNVQTADSPKGTKGHTKTSSTHGIGFVIFLNRKVGKSTVSGYPLVI